MTLQELVNALSNALAVVPGNTPVVLADQDIEKIIINDDNITIV